MSDPDALENAPPPEKRRRLVGHGAAMATLEHQLTRGRLPGAILLHGPKGIGKATFAFTFARRILTATGDEPALRVDEQVMGGSHPNLSVLRRRPRDTKGHYSVIRVEDVRALRDELHLTRGRAGHRVAVVDPIDECNVNSANALLKVLEEPPPQTSFLLVSHRPGQLLPTIRSRCHTVALRPLVDAELAEVLAMDGVGFDAGRLDSAVALAGGRPRRAYEALSLEAGESLGALSAWLAAPDAASASSHLAIADAMGGADPRILSFAREQLTDWMAAEARAAALAGNQRVRLASAGELWEKARARLAEADALNLDSRQTLVGIFDAVRDHVRRTRPSPIPEQ